MPYPLRRRDDRRLEIYLTVAHRLLHMGDESHLKDAEADELVSRLVESGGAGSAASTRSSSSVARG